MASTARIVSPHDDISIRLAKSFGLEPGELRRLVVILDAGEAVVEFKVTAYTIGTPDTVEALTGLIEAASPDQIKIERREA